MVNTKISRGGSIVVMIASSISGVAYAKDGDIYNTSNVNIGGIGGVILNKSSMLDFIMNMKTYGYEVGGKIYSASDVNDEFNNHPNATLATVYSYIEKDLHKVGDAPIAIQSVRAINGTITVTGNVHRFV